MRPKVLTIAGSDSGGGAGIQADLKTFTVLGTYGASVVTALTAQNTLGVQGIFQVDPAFVSTQIDAVLGDIGADAAKTGMLNTAAIVEAVADAVERHALRNLVVDPVMVAKSGDRLLKNDAVRALKKRLIPLAAIVTPNTEEATILTDTDGIQGLDDMKRACERLVSLGAQAVLLKGGHIGGSSSDDLWFDGSTFVTLPSPRFDNRHTHGTGCTMSAALAAYLALGLEPLDAARRAKHFISEAIRTARSIGKGIGPVNHFWQSETSE